MRFLLFAIFDHVFFSWHVRQYVYQANMQTPANIPEKGDSTLILLTYYLIPIWAPVFVGLPEEAANEKLAETSERLAW